MNRLDTVAVIIGSLRTDSINRKVAHALAELAPRSLKLGIVEIDAFGANHHLRQSLVSLNVPTMPQPEAYLGLADRLFDTNGKLTDESARRLLQKFMNAFAVWTAATAVALAGDRVRRAG